MSCISVCAHCLLFFHWIPLRRVWLYFLYTHYIRSPSMLLRIPSNPTLTKVKQSQPSAFPTMSDAPIHLWFLWCFPGLPEVCSRPSCSEEPSTGPSTPGGLTRLSEESPSLNYWPCPSLTQQQQPHLLQKHISICSTCCLPGYPSDVQFHING